MDKEIVQGNVNELKGQIKKTWGKLTDDDLTRLEGGGEELIGKVQKAYGYTKEKAQQEFEKFINDNPQHFFNKPASNDQEKIMPNTAQQLITKDIVEPAQQYIKKARELGSKAVEKGTDYVKENPGYGILGAAAFGFLAGAYFSRRR